MAFSLSALFKTTPRPPQWRSAPGDPVLAVAGDGEILAATEGAESLIAAEGVLAGRSLLDFASREDRAGLKDALEKEGIACPIMTGGGTGTYKFVENMIQLRSVEGKVRESSIAKLGEIVDEIGGGTATGRAVKAVQVGGPLGAYFPRELFDTPFDYEAFAGKDGLIGHAGIVVFDETADMVKQARFAFEFCAIESCGKCTPCRIGAVRGAETVDKIMQGIDREKNIELVADLCNTMKFGSLCALGGFTPYPVMSAMTHFPDDFAPRARAEAAE